MLTIPRATGARSMPKKDIEEKCTAAIVEEEISVVRVCMEKFGEFSLHAVP